jgi:hypothetical protein
MSLVGAAVLFLLVLPGGAVSASSRVGIQDGARIPILSPIQQRSPERDTPPAVLRLLLEEQRAAMARAQAAAKLKPSLAAGCRRVTDAGGAVRLGPPAPSVRARIIGHHVELLLRYRTLPRSDACRPAVETVVVFSGEPASSTFNNAGAVETYAVKGVAGRAIVDLPWNGHAPYRLLVSSETVLGDRGPRVELPLACPRAGCLAGYQPPLHTRPMPKPVLALRGLTRAQLEASLREVVAAERWPSVSATECRSLRSCVVTFVTPGFPKQPYRVRLAIAGQQIRGCWLAWYERILDHQPYPDAGRGPQDRAGCRNWLQ